MSFKTHITLLALIALLVGQTVHAQHNTTDSVGCKSFNIGRFATGAAFAVGFNAGIVETMKHTIHETRPDGSDNHSMPSRHAAWAFTAAAIATHELGAFSPWYSTGAQLLASAIGQQRVMAGRHFAGDVAAGASIAIVSTEAGYLISNAIFGKPCDSHSIRITPVPERPYIEVESAIAIPLRRTFGRYNVGTGYKTKISGVYGINDFFDMGVAAALRSAPITTTYDDLNTYLSSLNRLYMTVGIGASTQPASQWWAISGNINLGYVYTFLPDHVDEVSHSAPIVNANVKATTMIHRNLAISATMGYEITRLRLDYTSNSLQSFNIGISTRAYF